MSLTLYVVLTVEHKTLYKWVSFMFWSKGSSVWRCTKAQCADYLTTSYLIEFLGFIVAYKKWKLITSCPDQRL